jgi:hypothetical protein
MGKWGKYDFRLVNRKLYALGSFGGVIFLSSTFAPKLLLNVLTKKPQVSFTLVIEWVSVHSPRIYCT